MCARAYDDNSGGLDKRWALWTKGRCVRNAVSEVWEKVLRYLVFGRKQRTRRRRRRRDRGTHGQMMVLQHRGSGRAEPSTLQVGPKRVLQLRDLRHHCEAVLVLPFELLAQLLILKTHALDLLAEFFEARVGALAGSFALVATAEPETAHETLVAVTVATGLDVILDCGGGVARVDAAEMLVEVLLAREALARVAFAVWVRAVDCVLGAAMLAVDFALVTEETARVSEAGELLAALGSASVGSLVLVHVLAVVNPLAKLLEGAVCHR